MTFWDDFYDLMPRTILVDPWVSEDSGGNVTYGTQASYQCAIRDDVKAWKWEDGNELQSRRTIYVNAPLIGKKDRITLPATYDPRIVFPLVLIRRDDEASYHHTEILI